MAHAHAHGFVTFEPLTALAAAAGGLFGGVCVAALVWRRLWREAVQVSNRGVG